MYKNLMMPANINGHGHDDIVNFCGHGTWSSSIRETPLRDSGKRNTVIEHRERIISAAMNNREATGRSMAKNGTRNALRHSQTNKATFSFILGKKLLFFGLFDRRFRFATKVCSNGVCIG
jgi:hypothetical protein